MDAETEDLANLHLTKDDGKDRRKKWSISPENLEPEIVKWIEKNSTPMDLSAANEMNFAYHCVSGWRVFASIRLLAGLLTPLEWLIFRPLSAFGIARISAKEDLASHKVRVVGYIDMTRFLRLTKKFRPLRRPLEKFLPVLVLKIAPRVAKLLLTRVDKLSSGDVALLVPKRQGYQSLVIIKSKQSRQINAAKIIEKIGELYRELELEHLIPDPNAITSSGERVPFRFETTGRRDN